MDILLSLFNVNFIEYQTKFVLNRILKAERSFGCLFFFLTKEQSSPFFWSDWKASITKEIQFRWSNIADVDPLR